MYYSDRTETGNIDIAGVLPNFSQVQHPSDFVEPVPLC